MTRAHETNPTRRIVVSGFGEELVVEVYSRRLVLRPKGCKRGGPAEVEVGPGQLYQRLLVARAEEKRRAKKRARRRS